jgi:hypothetical protein
LPTLILPIPLKNVAPVIISPNPIVLQGRILLVVAAASLYRLTTMPL